MGAEQLCPHKLNVLKCCANAALCPVGDNCFAEPPQDCDFMLLYQFIGNPDQNFTGFAERYFFTISAILKTIAWSNSRRSRPVSFFIFSSL